jgi:hypothetical protein
MLVGMRDLVVYGLGELGRLYGAGALRAGIRVTPITHATSPSEVLATVAADVPVLVAVQETSLDEVLAQIPPSRADSVILLQNDLFPSRYEGHGLRPTVIVPWLLQKRGTPLTIARATPVFGRHAALVQELHHVLEIPGVTLDSEPALRKALVEKYAFILGINALGVLRDRTLAGWMQEDPMRVRALTAEAAKLGAALAETSIDPGAADRAVSEAFHALGTMSARGRSAEGRVRRALAQAAERQLALPELTRVAHEAGL